MVTFILSRFGEKSIVLRFHSLTSIDWKQVQEEYIERGYRLSIIKY